MRSLFLLTLQTLLVIALLQPGKCVDINSDSDGISLDTIRGDLREGGVQFTFSYPRLTRNSSVAAERINKQIEEKMILATWGESSDSSVYQVATNYFATYSSDTTEPMFGNTGGYVIANAEIMYNKNHLLSIRYSAEIGDNQAAHPSHQSLCQTFDVHSEEGSIIKLEDLFYPSAWNQVLNVAESIFREQMGIPADQMLNDHGLSFEEEKFKLPEDFCIAEAGVYFRYGAYTIGAGHYGEIELLVPFEKVAGLIRKDGPIGFVIDG